MSSSSSQQPPPPPPPTVIQNCPKCLVILGNDKEKQIHERYCKGRSLSIVDEKQKTAAITVPPTGDPIPPVSEPLPSASAAAAASFDAVTLPLSPTAAAALSVSELRLALFPPYDGDTDGPPTDCDFMFW
ncbi:hypothetical protein QVD17_33718 [Tagetes erecta]|uniref:Uncharacterized protein n=1 Tax=Tagetes erecta TaxID=13708 RepID=A0AAD8JYP0_TARER|nr:hypothetical protein QVD17_33718 [Tagetes erecta]